MSEVKRLAVFAGGPGGGNPAGVWVGESFPDDGEMQRIAADIGFSETVFITPARGPERRLRYFSPECEVSFCGHATIAAGVELGRREGPGGYRFHTSAGVVTVDVREDGDDLLASLTSVAPKQREASRDLLDAALSALDWNRSDLDGTIPPVLAYAGAWHLILAAAIRPRLAQLEYDFEALKSLMLDEGLTTVQLVYREHERLFFARNPFPIGGIVEDPATGSAAAALGGYLRSASLINAPADFIIRQGEDMGKPSVIKVHVPDSGGIIVSGTAMDIRDG